VGIFEPALHYSPSPCGFIASTLLRSSYSNNQISFGLGGDHTEGIINIPRRKLFLASGHLCNVRRQSTLEMSNARAGGGRRAELYIHSREISHLRMIDGINGSGLFRDSVPVIAVPLPFASPMACHNTGINLQHGRRSDCKRLLSEPWISMVGANLTPAGHMTHERIITSTKWKYRFFTYSPKLSSNP